MRRKILDPIRREEIKDLASYERTRADLRRRVIELRRERRVGVGDRLSLVFESREAVFYQIQEALRAERTTDEAAIQHEIETYSELLPKPLSLSGTLFVENEDVDRLEQKLGEFAGIDSGECLWFDLGGAGRTNARILEGVGREGRPYGPFRVRFTFTPEAASAFRDPGHPVSLVVELPTYRVRVEVEGATRRALSSDLCGE